MSVNLRRLMLGGACLFAFCFSFLPVHAFNFVVNQGLWLSNANPFAGDKVKIYTVVINNNFALLSGTAEFYKDGALIGTMPATSLKYEEARQLWIEYVLPAGEQKFEVKMANVVAKDDQGKIITLSASDIGGFGAEQTFFVDIDTDKDSIGNEKDPDDDNDGLTDEEEKVRGTDSLKVDTDGDTLGDADEVKKGLSPIKKDTDADSYEDNSDLFPLDKTEWADADKDGTGDNADLDDDNDGLSDEDEKTLGSDPLKADTDGDSVNDGDEKKNGSSPIKKDTDGDGLDDFAEIAMKTDPSKADTDGEGLDDQMEKQKGTNPLVADSDEDGLSDRDEITKQTDPLKKDSDADGVNDIDDLFPLDPSETIDTDKDGIGNNKDKDDDNDGLLDTEEDQYKTNHLVADTDGDSINDHEEIRKGTDPNIPNRSWFNFSTKSDEGASSASTSSLPTSVSDGDIEFPIKQIVQYAALGSFILFLFFIGLYKIKSERNYDDDEN